MTDADRNEDPTDPSRADGGERMGRGDTTIDVIDRDDTVDTPAGETASRRESATGGTAEDDPVGVFLRDMELHGKSERTRTEYERVLGRFQRFLRGRGERPASASHRDCTAFVHRLRTDDDLASSTVATYAAYLHRFYDYMTRAGEFDANPMALVMEELDERIDPDPERREISVPEMRAFVERVRHPLHRAVFVTLLKTGIRVGELCNLDCRDLRLERDLPGYELGNRPQLDNRPDSLYVPSEPSVGSSYNGEERTASNKRKRATTIPVDGELQQVLVRWLAIRPDTASDARPLFCSTASGWGERLTPERVQRIVRTYATDHGWYEQGAGATENVTPHYFRHFFTTHLRERTGERGIVKYLRGDVADDVIDTYTHDWGGRVRETYERQIYSVL